MSDTPSTYAILTKTHVNQWDNDLRTAVPGWQLQVKWNATSQVIPVFIPDSQYTPDQVNARILAAGAKDEAISNLGG